MAAILYTNDPYTHSPNEITRVHNRRTSTTHIQNIQASAKHQHQSQQHDLQSAPTDASTLTPETQHNRKDPTANPIDNNKMKSLIGNLEAEMHSLRDKITTVQKRWVKVAK
jgi:hypothetical protein